MSKLSKYEKETIILFNDAESTATVETCNKAWKNKMRALCSKSPDCILAFTDEHCDRYLIPKKWVRVQISRQISEQQRQKMQITARENFHNKGADV